MSGAAWDLADAVQPVMKSSGNPLPVGAIVKLSTPQVAQSEELHWPWRSQYPYSPGPRPSAFDSESDR